MPIATVDPTTGRTLKTFDPLTPSELEDRLSRAHDRGQLPLDDLRSACRLVPRRS